MHVRQMLRSPTSLARFLVQFTTDVASVRVVFLIHGARGTVSVREGGLSRDADFSLAKITATC